MQPLRERYQGFRNLIANRSIFQVNDLRQTSKTGSSSARLGHEPAMLEHYTHAVFTEVIQQCDALVALQMVSNNRASLPQIRADLSDPEIRGLAVHFGLGIVDAGAGPDGSLRCEAAKAGISAIIYEAGEPYRFQEEEIRRGAQGVANFMAYLDMTAAPEQEVPDSRTYRKSRWMRAGLKQGGFFFRPPGSVSSSRLAMYSAR